MTEVQELRLVKSRQENVSDVLFTIIGVAMLYYSFRPTALERHANGLREKWHRMQHRLSVWQALTDIRSLPETRK